MKLLLHQCCGPCSIYPITCMKNDDITVTTYFYNPNIHPIQEFYKRMESSVLVADYFDTDYILEDDYGLIDFTRQNAFHENERCHHCYEIRIKKTAEKAKEGCFDAFSTSLLYSKMQNHNLIKEICEKEAIKNGIEFYYQDFRCGWQEGIDISKEMEIYRQNYCGCIYSEEDRFKNQLSKKFFKKFPKEKIRIKI